MTVSRFEDTQDVHINYSVMFVFGTTPALRTPTSSFSSRCAGLCLVTGSKHHSCLRGRMATGMVQYVKIEKANIGMSKNMPQS